MRQARIVVRLGLLGRIEVGGEDVLGEVSRSVRLILGAIARRGRDQEVSEGAEGSEAVAMEDLASLSQSAGAEDEGVSLRLPPLAISDAIEIGILLEVDEVPATIYLQAVVLCRDRPLAERDGGEE